MSAGKIAQVKVLRDQIEDLKLRKLFAQSMYFNRPYWDKKEDFIDARIAKLEEQLSDEEKNAQDLPT